MLFVNLNAGIGAHQAALADALYGVLGDNYVFIEFAKDQIQYGSYKDSGLGKDYYKNRPYILRMFDSSDNERRARELIYKADVLRTGGEPLDLTKARIKAGKLTFRSSERIIKKHIWERPGYLRTLYSYFFSLANANYRVLCQSAYLPNDIALCGFRNNCYKFAYFTEVPQLDIDTIINKRGKDKIKMVWCARFLDWKHPELPILLAEKLVQSGRRNFEIIMIGADATPLWFSISDMIESHRLNDYVSLTGGLPNIEVQKQMKDSHIFIFTSDREEGWGAVLNEAMGSGCACVASNEIGAVPYLISNEKNGMIFKSCSLDSLFEKVARLYDNPNLRNILGKAAYHTITTDWSSQLAAERLVNLSESILVNKEISYTHGPCSKAKPITSRSLV